MEQELTGLQNGNVPGNRATISDLEIATSLYLNVRRPPSRRPVLRVSVPLWLACLIFSRLVYDALHPPGRLADRSRDLALVQGAGRGCFQPEQERPCEAAVKGPRKEIFFDGTNLPISLKTKGRRGRSRETNLPFRRGSEPDMRGRPRLSMTQFGLPDLPGANRERVGIRRTSQTRLAFGTAKHIGFFTRKGENF